MSDLSTLKKYLASIHAEKRAHRASIIPQRPLICLLLILRQFLLLLKWGFSGIWSCHSGGFKR